MNLWLPKRELLRLRSPLAGPAIISRRSLVTGAAAVLAHAALPKDASAQDGHMPQPGRGYIATDFREYPTGSTPADWTLRGSTASVTTGCAAASGSPGGRNMTFAKTTDTYSFLAWNIIPTSHTDIDLVYAILLNNINTTVATVNNSYVFWRCDGVVTNSMSCSLTVSVSGADSINLSALPATLIATANIGTYTTGVWYFIRCQSIGNNHKVKFWARGTAEPAAWAISASNSSVTSGNYCGPGGYYGTSFGLSTSFNTGWFAANLGATASAPMPQG